MNIAVSSNHAELGLADMSAPPRIIYSARCGGMRPIEALFPCRQWHGRLTLYAALAKD